MRFKTHCSWTLEATNRTGLCPNGLFVLCVFYCLWRRVALETLDRLTESLDFTDYASRIIHPIVRTLDSTPELRSTSMDTLSSLVFQLGKKVTIAVLRLLFIYSCYNKDDFQPSFLLAAYEHEWYFGTPSHKSLLLPARPMMSLSSWR